VATFQRTNYDAKLREKVDWKIERWFYVWAIGLWDTKQGEWGWNVPRRGEIIEDQHR